MAHRYQKQLEYIRNRPGQVTMAHFLADWGSKGAIAWLVLAKADLVCIKEDGRLYLTDAGANAIA
ncbi:MAG: hypothetical protein M3Y22_08800 [Pseudomonadota bacterium]|nr:hypothetical protein [Pseudomonadota bacterium]